jgi:RNA polymerase sigma-70 factor, ECF subfamily
VSPGRKGGGWVTSRPPGRFSLRHEHEATLTAVPLPLSDPVRPSVDSTLIARAKLGDIQAFEAIVERYYPRCLRFARGMLRNAADVDDVVQETFVRLYRALPRYEERQRFDAWIFRILGNCCRTANTVQQRREVQDVTDEHALAQLASPHRPDSRLDEEWGDEVRQALEEVPEYNREIFLLHYIEGFSYDEIERITGVRQSALKMRVKRAADLLRSRLAGVYRG